jgi:nucleotide-binding universal stress UspA family protein
MPKSIMVSLTGFASDEAAMEGAFAVAAGDKAHIEALHTRVNAADILALEGFLEHRAYGAVQKMETAIRQEDQSRSAAARKIYDTVCARYSKGGRGRTKSAVTSAFREITTLDDATLRQARFHDLTVAARAPQLGAGRLDRLVMLAGKPVLIPPAKPATTIGKSVLVAWKDGAESARAVTAAMPLLARAQTVTLLSVCEGKDESLARRSVEEVAMQLKRHGITARVRTQKAAPSAVANKIRETAYALKADMIVMGAYGHSRAREWVLGGATRELLAVCDVSLLMAH